MQYSTGNFKPNYFFFQKQLLFSVFDKEAGFIFQKVRK